MSARQEPRLNKPPSPPGVFLAWLAAQSALAAECLALDAQGALVPRDATAPLAGSRVHVWSVLTDVPPPLLARCEVLLDTAEHSRWAGLQRAADRRRFAVRRGVLRLLLAECLGITPTEIAYRTQAEGKPVVARDDLCPGLDFSMSRAGDIALLAIGRGCQVGVDVAEIASRSDDAAVANRFLPPEEAARVAEAPAVEQPRVFAEVWTRFEAALKAEGRSLTSVEAAGWPVFPPPGVSLHTFTPRPTCVATLAIAPGNQASR